MELLISATFVSPLILVDFLIRKLSKQFKDALNLTLEIEDCVK